jgi:titin
MTGHEQPGGSRSRRLFRRASIAFALVVLVAFVIGDARPAFAVPPDAPQLTGVVAIDSAIVVQFDPPTSDGGSPILSYTATCTPTEGGTEQSNQGAPPGITVSGLTNGSPYQCNVFAHNADGDGPTSPFSDPAIPNGKPDPPPQPTLLPLNSSILVSFITPFDGGSPITGYSATCTSPDDPGGGASGTGPTSPIDVLGLLNGVSYTCTVSASNANGFGAASQPSAGAVPNTVPNTPDPPSVSSPLTGGISVSFTSPFDGGSAITGYTVACISSDGGLPSGANGTTSPILVTGVSVGNTYTCTLIATNVDGDSGTSQPSLPVVPGAVPDAPVQPTVVAGNARITVSFVAPFNGGSAITGYTAHCASANGVPNDAVGPSSPLVVPGLSNGRSYICNVRATNAFGSGAASPASSAVVPKTLPGRPAAPVVKAGNARLTVGFLPPANTGGFPITKYRVYCGSANGGVTRQVFTTTLQVVVAGVTNGKSYQCNLTAYTVVGASPVSLSSLSATPTIHGFRLFTASGSVYGFGASLSYGSINSPSIVVALLPTPDDRGYWLVNQAGGVYPFGDAKRYGSLAGRRLTRPIVGAAATPTGHGYWLVGSDGGIFAFGDAHFYGSTGNRRLALPIVGMTATASGHGYWFVAQDGGLFAFGDAHFYGSAPGGFGRCSAASLGNCVIGMATAHDGKGYWIASGNGRVAAFGPGTSGLTRAPIKQQVYLVMGIASTDTGNGFWITALNGQVYVTGDAPYIPWPGPTRLNSYVRGVSR